MEGGVYYQIDPQYDRTLPDGTPNYTRVFYPTQQQQQQPLPSAPIPVPVHAFVPTATTTTAAIQTRMRNGRKRRYTTGEAKYVLDADSGDEMKWCTSCESFDPLATWPTKDEKDKTAGDLGISFADGIEALDGLPMSCGSCKTKRQARAKDKREEAEEGKQQATEEEWDAQAPRH